MTIETRWIDKAIDYDGSQLRAHWILQQTGIIGDAIVAFRGRCAVKVAEIADLADLDGPGIAADDMLHFVWETFSTPDLLLAVYRQRLLSAQAAELLRATQPDLVVSRSGDDLWVGDGKLSISIATVSPTSSLIHFALNCSPGGAPVRIACLQQLGVEPQPFAAALLARVAEEVRSIGAAQAQVRGKGEWR